MEKKIVVFQRWISASQDYEISDLVREIQKERQKILNNGVVDVVAHISSEGIVLRGQREETDNEFAKRIIKNEKAKIYKQGRMV